jgi:hypothetical protein
MLPIYHQKNTDRVAETVFKRNCLGVNSTLAFPGANFGLLSPVASLSAPLSASLPPSCCLSRKLSGLMPHPLSSLIPYAPSHPTLSRCLLLPFSLSLALALCLSGSHRGRRRRASSTRDAQTWMLFAASLAAWIVLALRVLPIVSLARIAAPSATHCRHA